MDTQIQNILEEFISKVGDAAENGVDIGEDALLLTEIAKTVIKCKDVPKFLPLKGGENYCLKMLEYVQAYPTKIPNVVAPQFLNCIVRGIESVALLEREKNRYINYKREVISNEF